MSKLDAKLSPLNADKTNMTNSVINQDDSLHYDMVSKLTDDESIAKQWQAFIEARIGFVLPENQHNWFWQAINRLTRETQSTQKDLLVQAMQDDLLAQKVINAILIPQSQFFRHPPTFNFISNCAKQQHSFKNSSLSAQTALDAVSLSDNSVANKCYSPLDLQNRNNKNDSDIELTKFKAWSVGCSFGQEVWSIAMTLDDLGMPYQVWGSDVNSSALDWAKAGHYDSKQLAEIPPMYRKFVNIDGANWSIIPKLRQHAKFLYYNLINPELPHLPLVDIIICQNVLIYFRQFEQRDILARLVQQLKLGGHLILAPEDANRWRHPLMERLHGLTVNAWVRVK